MPECQYCTALCINTLVELAKKEFSGHVFPKQAYYKHHDSIDDLEKSAENGCSFCLFVLRCSKAIPSDAKEMWEQDYHSLDCESAESASIYEVAKSQPQSDIKIAINSSHLYVSEPLDLVRLFDVLMVQIGPSDDFTNPDLEGEDRPLEFMSLTLTAPKGMPSNKLSPVP